MGNNLIAISGKINSGKDTVGKIIQYLTLDKEVFAMTNADIMADLEYNGYCASKSNWQIKKFADKLKDIVCILIGCTREQLEDREFKEKTMEDLYKERIMKEITKKTTVREILQQVGTEFGRSFSPNIWVNALFSEYKLDSGIVVKPINEQNKAKYPIGFEPYYEQYFREPRFPNWIITDMRFPNELQAVKDRGGITIRVNRPIEIIAQHQSFLENHPANHPKNIIIGEHPSETALDNAEFDFVIDNNKDIEHLVNEVKSVLEKLNLLNP